MTSIAQGTKAKTRGFLYAWIKNRHVKLDKNVSTWIESQRPYTIAHCSNLNP